jgi:hypothetical protein
MLIWRHVFNNNKKLQLDFSLFFIKKKKIECHVSIEGSQNDTKKNSSISQSLNPMNFYSIFHKS